MDSTGAKGLPPNKRYILTHDRDGKSIVHSAPPQHYHAAGGDGGLARSYSVPAVPAVLKDDVDIAAYLSTTGPTSFMGGDIVVPNGTGANLLVVDLAPGGRTGMHRTVSLDFSICVIGHICMELDGGEVLELRAGVNKPSCSPFIPIC